MRKHQVMRVYNNYVKSIIMKIGNKAQWNFFTSKIRNHQNYIGFKVYVCLVKTKSMHTYPKYKWVHKGILHEKQVTQGYTCISKVLTKLTIHEAKTNIYENKNREY